MSGTVAAVRKLAAIIDIEGCRAAHRKMKTMTKKSKTERGQIAPFAKFKSGNLSSRDPVAVAAVLQMLG
jgi:hypothetical protein